ncbi:MAG: peptide chain release factor N(5)-glutamine methyltransferase, partial [Treponema sp.]|nr:peptide chain release factor N(5)-glutamine methyltransferase [Treponema sp.]
SALAPEVRREPRLALDGGTNGLTIIKKIILKAQEHLLPGGVILFEAAPGQMPEIKTLLENHYFSGIRIRKDLAGWERVISGISG